MSTLTTLLIDADDTLWENNIYFERVSAEFFDRLMAHGVSQTRAQEVLWQTEQRNIKKTGYGSKPFCTSLHETACALSVTDLEPWVAEQEQFILNHPIELMPGVLETLPKLRAKNRLILVTKGQPAEQHGKLERSGLATLFHETEVVFEKDVAVYQSLLAKHKLAAANTWMIGNSPRSDINPAKAAGMPTVFIPYHTTWEHEMEEIAPAGRTLVLAQFGELAAHFG